MIEIKKRTRVSLVVLLSICVVGIIGACLVQSGFGSIEVTNFNVTMSDLADQIRINNQKYGKNIDISFSSNAIYNYSFTLYKPKTATESTKAPAIVMVHGMFGSRGMAANNFIELARRGFVVINIDGAGHGRTDFGIDSLAHGSWGTEAAAEWAMSLGYVDESLVGITGHSRGGTVGNKGVTAINTGSKNHLRVYLSGSALYGLIEMPPEATQGMIVGLSSGKYEEGDGKNYKTAYLMTNKDGIGYQYIRAVFSGFSGNEIPSGVFFGPNGPLPSVDISRGESLKNVSTARALWNPNITHGMWGFSNIATKNTLTFFYSAMGTPGGAKFINPDSQIWPLYFVFTTLCLLCFFGLLFPLFDILIATGLFSSLKKKENEPEITLPVFNVKECLLWLACVITMTAYGFWRFSPDMVNADSYVSMNSFIYGGGVGNGLAVWILDTGVFSLFVACLIYFVRRVLYRRTPEVTGNPFTFAGLKSPGQFFRIVLLAFVLVALMYVPVYLAWHLAHIDFRIATFAVNSFRFIRFPSLIKYMPFWVLFYLMHAVMNPGFRYRNIPDGISTAICAITNILPLLIFLIVQYHSLFTVYYLWDQPASTPTGIAWNLIGPAAFAAVTTRYIFNRTHNAWVAGLVNTVLMVFLTVGVINQAVPFWFA
jgi:hypothetical protein